MVDQKQAPYLQTQYKISRQAIFQRTGENQYSREQEKSKQITYILQVSFATPLQLWLYLASMLISELTLLPK